jgi:hypothetical protein
VKVFQMQLLAAAVFAVVATGLLPIASDGGLAGPPVAHAQNLGMRLVTGRVLDAGDGVVVGATVFLKDLKGKNIRSYSSDKDGHFRFANVYMAEDHELWAEKDGKKSAVKTISSWDARKEMEVDLKLK